MQQPLNATAGSAIAYIEPAKLSLPDGWEVAEYAGQGGRVYFAVYQNGRRMASGMTNPQSAARWALLLASSTSSARPQA